MARADAKTVSAAALIGLAVLNSGRTSAPASPALPIVTPVRKATPLDIDDKLRPVIAQKTEEKIKSLLSLPEHEISIVIASVADPDRTSLRLSTDRTIDSLLLAAFQEGYILDDQWIPWRFSLEQMDQDYSDRRLEKEAIEEQSKFPGVLVLENKRDLLVYLLVPESPTAGINRGVLDKAISYVRRYDSDKKAPFVGPSFTAGMESMEEWLQDAPRNAEVLSRIVSGNVTGATKEQASRLMAGTCQNKLHFQVVRTPRDESDRLIKDFLRNTRGGRDSLRRLVEDSTRFGMSAGAGERTLSFPWQISRVRNATPELMANDARDIGDYRLQLQMRESRKPEGALPTFAGTQTPAVQEVVLTQIADRLERDRADYVSIVATDVLDAVFLAKLLHVSNPGQRVMTNQLDLIYLRAQEGYSSTGLLSTGSFSISNHLRLKPALRPSREGEPAPDNRDREPRNMIFDSEFSAATFTAALHAIRHQHQPPGEDQQFRLRFEGVSERPFWLFAMGRNGYWPVARLDSGEGVGLIPDPPNFTWLLLFCFSLAAAAAWFIASLAVRFGRISALEDIHVETGDPEWHKEALTLTIVSAAAGLAFAVAAAPLWWSAFRQPRIAGAWIVAAWAGLFMLTAAGVVPWVHRSQKVRHQVFLFAIGAFPLLAAIGLNSFGPQTSRYMLIPFFLLRSQDYLNGIAPLLPLLILLLGGVGYAWSLHIGTVLTQERYIRLGALNSPRFCCKRFGLSALAAAAAAMFPFAWVSWRQLHSLEPLVYDRIFIVLLYLLLTATTYACVRFVQLWCNIKRFLNQLELHPIHEALQAMPKEKDGAPVWESHPRRRSSWFYQRAESTLVQLRTLEDPESQPDPVIARLRQYLTSTAQEAAKINVEEPLESLGIRFEKELNRNEGPWTGNFEATAADRVKQQFLAYRFGAFLRCCFLHLRNRISAMTTGFVAITLSLNSYAFGPERMIQALTVGLVLLMGTCVVSVFFQMHRHPMLAMLSGAEGKLDWGPWAKIASVAAIPLLTLVASYTPAVGRFIGKWLQPALEAVTK